MVTLKKDHNTKQPTDVRLPSLHHMTTWTTWTTWTFTTRPQSARDRSRRWQKMMEEKMTECDRHSCNRVRLARDTLVVSAARCRLAPLAASRGPVASPILSVSRLLSSITQPLEEGPPHTGRVPTLRAWTDALPASAGRGLRSSPLAAQAAASPGWTEEGKKGAVNGKKMEAKEAITERSIQLEPRRVRRLSS